MSAGSPSVFHINFASATHGRPRERHCDPATRLDANGQASFLAIMLQMVQSILTAESGDSEGVTLGDKEV
jgi:hypothetical protein